MCYIIKRAELGDVPLSGSDQITLLKGKNQMAEQSKTEEWRVIKDFPDYAVSNCGRVKRIKRARTARIGRILKPRKIKDGYLRVSLASSTKTPKDKLVHRLVLKAFISPCPQGKECNHKDCNKLNNHVENLEWVTRSQNVQHNFDIFNARILQI